MYGGCYKVGLENAAVVRMNLLDAYAATRNINGAARYRDALALALLVHCER